MNWSLVFKYFSILVQVAVGIEGMLGSIAAGQSASTPAINTYVEGKHGSLALTWTPLP